ncbi:variable surface protein [Plasmodium gonderi]|uniref:Variable surface protein n=1 Tax=Plasmodium gonderi TaxID=77519 RepID=A0A1Y1JV93_PLAGO|nr:variable surface protein [Plasmodium gonderi]GAW84662.1 variable surface protein [Plasmodium gonderi]
MSPEPDFRWMFPNFTREYNDAIYIYRENSRTWLTDACKKFCNDVTGGNCGNFIVHCTDFGRYLYHINSKKNDEYTKQRCKYYFYKLMFELQQKSIDCGGVESCYKKMIQKLNSSNYLKGNPSCEAYIDEFDKRYLLIFSKLDKISDYIHKLISKHHSSCWSNIYKECDEHIRYLMSCAYKGKKKFYDMLENVVNTYKKLCPESRITLLPFIEESKNKAEVTMSIHSPADETVEQASPPLFTIHGFEEVPNNALDAVKVERMLSNGVSDVGNDSGVISGFFLSLFIIFSILFILYKVKNMLNFIHVYRITYTIFFSVLQSRIKRVRSIFNKKHSEHKNMMESLEREHNFKVYNRFQIAYNTDDYQ